jgi:hypothetical protein
MTTCIAVTIEGSIIRNTGDIGETWTVVYTTIACGLEGGIATDGNGVWCAAGDDYIVRSTDDGLNWAEYDVPGLTNSDRIRSIATNKLGVWCAYGYDETQWVIRSSDNGATWAVVWNDAGGYGLGIASNGGTIWLLGTDVTEGGGGSYVISRSTNNGVTWTNVYDNPGGRLFDAFVHVGGNNWLAAGASYSWGAIMASDDNGATWDDVYITTSTDYLILSAINRNASTGAVCVGSYWTAFIRRSADGATNWLTKWNATPSVTIDSMCTDNASTWWAGVAGSLGVLKSTDDGLNWTTVYTNGDGEQIYGIAVGSALSAAHIYVADVEFA